MLIRFDLADETLSGRGRMHPSCSFCRFPCAFALFHECICTMTMDQYRVCMIGHRKDVGERLGSRISSN